MPVHVSAAEDVAKALRVSIGLLVRRLRQVRSDGDLRLPETSALARLERGGPTTATALAKLEQISPQSMGATLDALEARGLVRRGPDPDDGRRMIVTATKAGLAALGSMRSARVAQLARALDAHFSRGEIETLRAAAPLLERLAQHV